MKGILCGTSAKTNEEYKKVIRQRMNIMVVIALIGVATIAIAFLAEFYGDIKIKEYMLGFYTGGGTGLFIIGIVFWIKNKLLLGNEEMLKKSRLNNTDERNMEISNKAFRFAALIMIGVLYGVALIGGLFYPILVRTVLLVITVFLLAYGVAYQVYNKRMRGVTMKKIILKYSTGAGLLIYAIFNIVNRIVPIKDYIAIPTCIVSIAFMMIGVAYHGWCFGKRKNPYK